MCRSEDGQSICSGKVVQCPASADGTYSYDFKSIFHFIIEKCYTSTIGYSNVYNVF